MISSETKSKYIQQASTYVINNEHEPDQNP